MEIDQRPPHASATADNDESFPNFSNAYPSIAQPTGEASWNPALRRNSEADPIPHSHAPHISADDDEDDDFFARYPGATPKKAQTEGRAWEAEASPLRRQSISVQQVVDVGGEDATEEELSQVPSSQVLVEGPDRGSGLDDDEEDMDDEELIRPAETTRGVDEDGDAILDPKDSIAQQRALLEEMPLSAASEIQSDEPIPEHSTNAQEYVTRPSEHYEHQSEATAMEEALEAPADVPLIEDEEPLPTPGYVSREPTFPIPTSGEDAPGLDGEAAPKLQPKLKSGVALPALDRSFTTNFSDSPIERSQPSEQQRHIPDDWPSAGDDRTFGELLDDQNPPAPPVQSHDATAEMLFDDDDGLLLDDDGDVPGEDLAAAWGAAIDDDDLLDETPTAATGDFDPSAVFGDDDGGFLEDEPVPAPVQQQQRQAPHTPSAPTDQMFGSHGRSAGTPSTGLFDVYNTAGAVQQPMSEAQRPAMPASTQSFVDKAKGGYQSPYDLPMDVVKPRRRPQQPPQQQQQQQISSPPPPPGSGPAFSNQRPGMAPPRSSSITSTSSAALGQVRPQAPQPAAGSVGTLSPPASSHGLPSQSQLPKAAGTPKSSSGFFEDLPMTVKPRQRPAGTYTPQQNMGMPGMPTPPPSMGMGQLPSLPPSRSATGDNLSGLPPQQFQQQQQQQQILAGLRKPEQMPLLPSQPPSHFPPTQAQAGPGQSMRYTPPGQQQQQPGSTLPAPAAPPAAASRFSPAPPAAAATGRYSPAPAAAQGAKQRNPSLPFAPRTSSPLAGMNAPLQPQFHASPPRANGMSQTAIPLSPERTGSRYTPIETPQQQMHQPPYPPQPAMSFPPPLNRPRTQSPDTTMKGPRAAVAAATGTARPSSSSAGTTPAPASYAMAQQPYQQQESLSQIPGAKRPALPHRRQFSRDLTFAAPADSRSQDPLHRWQGCPVFHWSPSGTIVSTFPKHTPFYAAGQGLPSVKCTPGVVTVQDASTFMPIEEAVAKFPGPLTARRKGGKKDVLAWTTGRIEGLEREAEGARLRFDGEGGEEGKKRRLEKVMLWKIVRIFVENDGILEGSPKIEEEVRKILLPDLEQMAMVADLQSPASSSVTPAVPEAVEKQVLFQIRQALLEGQRERAVWLAEEKKLWGHAMLIASTMGPETWKSVSASFVRSQVKSVGSDARSTAAVYQVFAGNAEECVDELVPPSARAGFRMISKADGSISGNPLEGLDQWRETLGLITSNRTAGDGTSLLALGRLLAGYGRVEAAHICYLFARHVAKLSGADDAETHFVLLGANHTSEEALPLGSDLDTIILTEIYEYAASLSAPANTPPYLPHLQPYKLIHAQRLAASGLKTAAQTYADAITVAYTSTTRPSGYYHPAFTSCVAEFAAFLSQTPHDGKGSLFSRPAMKTVSSGAASWFSKFVAGDEDTGSEGSGAAGEAGVGPFGRVSGESPELSRSGSGSELYGAAMMGGGMPIPGPQTFSAPAFAPSSAPGRYAPGAAQQFAAGGGKYAPGQAYSGMGFPAAEPQRPSSGYARYAPAPSSSSLGVPRPDVARRASDHSLPYAPSSRRGSAQDTTSSQGSYEPRPLLAEADTGSTYSYSPAVQSPLVQAQQADNAVHDPPPPLDVVANGIQPPLPQDMEESALDAESGGYQPPTGGYEPPSYEPYQPDPESPESAPSKPRKTFGDDDDDDAAALASRAAALKSSQKSAADRQADDAFRAAAEADAARDKTTGGDARKGWLTGWFGGKKDANNLAPGPIKAKLGEENSFYYDEQLKKWVNKKAGAEAATPAAPTPPPPRATGPPSRASSGMGGAPPMSSGRPPTSGSGPVFSTSSGPPSRVGTPGSEGLNGETGAPPLAAFSAAAMAPPLRPSSSLSTASSIDDLLAGPPGSRKGGTVKGKKRGGRYVDVMAK